MAKPTAKEWQAEAEKWRRKYFDLQNKQAILCHALTDLLGDVFEPKRYDD